MIVDRTRTRAVKMSTVARRTPKSPFIVVVAVATAASAPTDPVGTDVTLTELVAFAEVDEEAAEVVSEAEDDDMADEELAEMDAVAISITSLAVWLAEDALVV